MSTDDNSPPDVPDSLDVIAVGAHPDDVEIGCGGTLARLVQQGYGVGIVDLTDGEPTPGSPSPEVRLAEAAEAARILGVHRETMTFPNRRLFDGFEVRVELAKIFRRFRPRIVIGLEGRSVLLETNEVGRDFRRPAGPHHRATGLVLARLCLTRCPERSGAVCRGYF